MSLYLYIAAPLLVLTALGVVVLRNPIHSGLCLVSNLFCVASLYAAMSAHFLATVQIVVYAGAVVVLVLFVLMLINVKVEIFNSRDRFSTVMGAAVGAAFLVVLLYYVISWLNQLKVRTWNSFAGDAINTNTLPQQTSAAFEGSIEAFGRELFTHYLLPFEISSVLLIAALVGATMLAERRGQVRK